MSKRPQRMLNRNEVVQGPSPKAIAAIRKFPAGHMNFYIPKYYDSVLIPKLSKKYGVPEGRIIVTCGAEDLLHVVFDTLDPARDNVLTHELHFDFYHVYLDGRGVRHHEFRLIEGKNGFSFDIDDCIAKIKVLAPKLILITSPNNPTGNTISPKDAERVLAAAPKHSIVAIDEAYYGFDRGYNEKKFLALLKKYPNLMLVRTFSKLYALAGLRIGYALCGKDIVPMLKYIRPRLGGSRILEEVAAAALESPAYYRTLANDIITERERAIRAINKLRHFKAFSAQGNHFAVKVDPEAKTFLENEMAQTSVLVCKFYAEYILRVTVTPRKYMEPFLAMMARADAATSRAVAGARATATKKMSTSQAMSKQAARTRRAVRYKAS